MSKRAKWKIFRTVRIGQESFESRRVIGFAVEFDEVCRAVAARELHEAQPVAMRIEPERLGIDRDTARERQPGRQISIMQLDFGCGHLRFPLRKPA